MSVLAHSREALFDDVVLTMIDGIKKTLREEILRDCMEANMRPGDLARKTGLAASDASDLMRGVLGRFSVDRLLAVLIKLGHDPRVQPV